MNGIKIQIKISCNNFNPFTIQNLIEEFSIGKNDTSALRFLAYDAPIPMHIICISMFQLVLRITFVTGEFRIGRTSIQFIFLGIPSSGKLYFSWKCCTS